MEIIMEKLKGNRHSCGSYFVDHCNCELVPGKVDNLKLNELNALCPQYLHSNKITKGNIYSQNSQDSHCSKSDGNCDKFQRYALKTPTTTRRELRSFSHPAINFIFTRANRQGTEAERNTLYHRVPNQLHTKIDLDQSIKESNVQRGSIDKAEQFLSESGILGPTNFSTSRDLIRKTSRIHLDLSLKSKIRKTSLCLLSRTFGEMCPPSTSPTPKITFEDSNELIIRNIQRQVNSIKGIIETGETKIIMLRAEVNKIKRVLQKLMYANLQNKMKLPLENPNLCVFCQEEPGYSQALLHIQPHTSII
ncbi:uncharacterized protein LOC117792713 [Drosophila innubila]|uniref:uncharacterized protein LOC117792713 n=1 Tax=Drosophila innubila TaxID=198719 RepID=UPI00148C4132|nr:uncharacterized protein LOC117792713 [Drosophila innubila]